jgi:hypothetical protein
MSNASYWLKGQKFKQAGRNGVCIRFALGGFGAATTTYNHSMTPENKNEIARRIVAALNYTSDMTIEEIEKGKNP